MITAKYSSNGTGAIILSSTEKNKSAEVWVYSWGWQIQYTQNGARKDFNEYHEILKHLQAAGW